MIILNFAGHMNTGSYNSDYILGTLPTAYKPPVTIPCCSFNGYSTDNANYHALVNTSGQIKIVFVNENIATNNQDIFIHTVYNI